ncbi:alpha-L-fucosidase [Occallatibacter riparius]|uniref:alpha-L-fucosidase n=1 Tax=Occallatibacter riparius TaxID=1002689 RepID=A0A9J7BP83_9BACT|nr:alpha-L-fucosidase [Occallatibacter riparius]UWZ84692.1 alpha-L-fucosidase [Occallatibacter riparius]
MKNLLLCLPLLALSAGSIAIAQSSAPADPLAPTLGVKSAAEIDREWQQSVSKYDAERSRLLKEADRQANDGPYRPDWATLMKYQQPQWYKDAKFGIFIHWGVYSVPAAENEWYPRNMYQTKEGAYKNFREHYAKGDDSKGYKDLIPLFKAEKFDAAEWAKLFKESGAQYVVPVAEHHDGFSMYDSGLSDWTVVKMGPKRDTLGELAKAIRAEGLHFGLSSHRAEHDFFYDGGRTMRSDVNNPKYASLYGPAHQWIDPGGDEHSLINDWTYVSTAWTQDWLARDTELVEKYKPEIVYFDWWIGHPVFRNAVAEFASFYYNYAAANGYTGVIDFKDYSLNWKAGVRDFERGQQDHIIADHWQTDTSISNKSWGYIENDTFKSPEFLVHQLVDIVSKNGNLLLNFGPRSDGTIPDEIQNTLREMGAWLKVNGEGIYGTTPWKTYGEGPTKVVAGAFHDTDTKPYTAEDFRFTTKGSTVYAIGMACPQDGKGTIHSLGSSSLPIGNVELLGSTSKVTWNQTAEALEVTLPAGASCKYAYTLKLTAK